MHGARTLAFLAILASSYQSTCRSSAGPGGTGQTPEQEADVHLPGVDTSSLTTREKRDWSSWVNELLAPCPSEPVSLAQCVREQRKCSKCLPSAKLLARKVREGRTRSQAEEAFYARFSPERVKNIDVGDAPTLGDANAEVTVVEWADFECPHCRHAVPILEKLVKDHPGKVRFAFKFYPLGGHAHSELTARAAAAAAKQGKFWEMHHALFERQVPLDAREIERCAKDVGLEMAKFKTDWESEAIADRVSHDRKQGDQLGIIGTPTIYIDGREFDLSKFDMQDDLNEWIDLEIVLATKGEQDRPAPAAARASASAAAGPTGPDPKASAARPSK